MDSIIVIMIIGTWVTALVAVGGVLVSWRKKDRTQAERDQSIKDGLTSISEQLDDKDTGLGALNARIHSFEINCATISTGYKERLGTVERDIKELKHPG